MAGSGINLEELVARIKGKDIGEGVCLTSDPPLTKVEAIEIVKDLSVLSSYDLSGTLDGDKLSIIRIS